MEKNNLQTPRINIYISNETKKFLQEIQEKYFISYSTITNLVFQTFRKHAKKITNLNNTYFEENRIKTSIKPRIARFMNALTFKFKGEEIKIKPSYIFSNLLFLVRTNKIKTFVNNYEKFKTELYSEFQKTNDPYYKYNYFAKNQPRFIKQNKKYIKKLLRLIK